MSTTDTKYAHVPTIAQAHCLNAVQRASENIRSECARVTSIAEQTVQHIDEGYHVNSLGVLQSTGRDLDRECGLRQAMVDAAKAADADADMIELASKGLGTFFVYTPESD
jgi:hypothetical protein